MDPAPRGLAPSGPGAKGAPLLDWILADPGLAGAVFDLLAPADVRGLRASCRGAKAAVAGHGWESPAAAQSWAWTPLPPLGDRIRAAAESGDEDDAFIRPQVPPEPQLDVSGGRAALARWRACFPRARGVVVGDNSHQDDDAIADADVAALAAGGQLVRLGLSNCDGLTDAALAPLTHLTSLAVAWTPSLTGACWAGLAGRLRSVETFELSVTDAHLPALSGCSHVTLGEGAAVTDGGVAAHLAGRVTHLSLDVTECRPFDGSCLRACARLVALQLVNTSHGRERELVPDALAGCAARLASIGLARVDGGGALLAACAGGGCSGGLPALRVAMLCFVPSLTDASLEGAAPRLTELLVEGCPLFVGGTGLGPPLSLEELDVRHCASFTGRALAAGGAPHLRWLSTRDCPRFAQWGSYGGGAQWLPQLSSEVAAPSALPALVGAYIVNAPALTDAWFARTPRLAHLFLDCCHGVVGDAALGGHLPGLTHLAVTGCDAFIGGWLGAAGGGASSRLEALSVRRCPALSLAAALAPVPHPRLRRAQFEGVDAPPLTDELLGARLPSLHALTVRRCAGFVGGPGLGGRLPALAELTVEGCNDFRGAGLGGLPALQQLDVAECPRVGHAELAAAAAGCPALTYVAYFFRPRCRAGRWQRELR
jgi:hypothetical protein